MALFDSAEYFGSNGIVIDISTDEKNLVAKSIIYYLIDLKIIG
jgi:hypothetical protein